MSSLQKGALVKYTPPDINLTEKFYTQTWHFFLSEKRNKEDKWIAIWQVKLIEKKLQRDKIFRYFISRMTHYVKNKLRRYF